MRWLDYWKNWISLGIHIRKTHMINPEIYYDIYLRKEDEGICKTCGKITKFRNLNEGYSNFCCLKCVENNSDIKEKILKTNEIKNGGIGFASNILKNKAIKTAIKNGNKINNAENIIKMRETMKNIYGEDCPSKIETFKNKIKNTKEEKNLGINYKFKYKNIYFDSSWELAYYIWLVDNNINFEYHKKHFYFNYEFEGKTHRYYPDFIINDKIIDIKNKHLYNKLLIENTIDNAKYECMKKNNVELLLEKDMVKYLNYIDLIYGKDYLMRFICKK